MPSQPRIKTRFAGVYYRESARRRFKGRADRCYLIHYRDLADQAHWERLGWASEGYTDKYANARRLEIIAALNTGSKPAPSLRGAGKSALRMTAGDAVDAYTSWARAEGKHIDRELNRYDLHIAPHFAAVPLDSITPAMLTEHKARLGDKMSPQSVHHCFSFLRRCINFVIKTGEYVGTNPVSSSRFGVFRLPPPPNEAVRFFTPEEAQALLADLQMHSPQTHDMSLLSLKTGLRATEIFRLTAADVDAASNVLHVSAKGGARQIVHAPAAVISMLMAYGRTGSEPIFQRRGGGRITRGISGTFERSVRRMGWNTPGTPATQRVRFHTWRHTFASWLAQSGQVTLHELKELMRHDRIEMTLRYAHLIPGHQRDSLSIIDKVLADHQ